MQAFLETGIPETLKLKGEVDVGTAKGIVEIVVSEDPTRNSHYGSENGSSCSGRN